MLLNSGSPSLISYTRFLVRDKGTDPRPMFTDAEITDVINAEYDEMREVMRAGHRGHTRKRTYADTSSGQLFYAQPSDFVAPVLVEVDLLGRDLSSNSSAEGTRLSPLDPQVALADYEGGRYTDTEFYFIHDQHIGIVAPISTAGTKSLRLTYEATTAHLSATTDEPLFPRPFHKLLCVRAGIILLTSIEEDPGRLLGLLALSEPAFRRWIDSSMEDPEAQIPFASAPAWTPLRVGRISRSGRRYSRARY